MVWSEAMISSAQTLLAYECGSQVKLSGSKPSYTGLVTASEYTSVVMTQQLTTATTNETCLTSCQDLALLDSLKHSMSPSRSNSILTAGYIHFSASTFWGYMHNCRQRTPARPVIVMFLIKPCCAGAVCYSACCAETLWPLCLCSSLACALLPSSWLMTCPSNLIKRRKLKVLTVSTSASTKNEAQRAYVFIEQEPIILTGCYLTVSQT